MVTVSPAMATTEAAEAAMPSIKTSTGFFCARRRFMIATPSKASPPGELMRSVTLLKPLELAAPSREALTALAVTPPPDHQSSPISS